MQQPVLDPQRRLAATAINLLPALKPNGSRGLIAEEALRLFAEQTYAGTSIRDITSACGIKPATLYAHYPSKEHLLAEVVGMGHEEHFSQLRRALLNSQPDPACQVVAFARAHVLFHANYPMLALVANAELHALSKQAGAHAHTLRNQSTQLLIDVIQRGVDTGVFNTPDVWLSTAAIGGMGLRVAYWYTPEFELDADAVADTYWDCGWPTGIRPNSSLMRTRSRIPTPNSRCGCWERPTGDSEQQLAGRSMEVL